MPMLFDLRYEREDHIVVLFQNLDRVLTGSRESLDGDIGSWHGDVGEVVGGDVGVPRVGGRGGFWWLCFPAGVCHSSSKEERHLGVTWNIIGCVRSRITF